MDLARTRARGGGWTGIASFITALALDAIGE